MSTPVNHQKRRGARTRGARVVAAAALLVACRSASVELGNDPDTGGAEGRADTAETGTLDTAADSGDTGSTVDTAAEPCAAPWGDLHSGFEGTTTYVDAGESAYSCGPLTGRGAVCSWTCDPVNSAGLYFYAQAGDDSPVELPSVLDGDGGATACLAVNGSALSSGQGGGCAVVTDGAPWTLEYVAR